MAAESLLKLKLNSRSVSQFNPVTGDNQAKEAISRETKLAGHSSPCALAKSVGFKPAILSSEKRSPFATNLALRGQRVRASVMANIPSVEASPLLMRQR